jgi:hypothetical protein
MDKVFKIVIVFALLMLIILFSFRAREKKFREYGLVKRGVIPLPGDPDWVTLMAAGAEAGPEARDLENRLLFSPATGMTAGMAITVSDAETGEPWVTIPLDEPAGALVFDPATKLLYSHSLEGVLTIIRQSGRDDYRIMQRLPVPKASRAPVLDLRTGKIYLIAEGQVWIYANG